MSPERRTGIAAQSLAADGFFIRMDQRSEDAELLDAPEHAPDELATNLRDIRLVNRLAGGSATVLRHLPALLDAAPRERPVAVLDLATGSGDIPRVIATWAARRGRSLAMTVCDVSPQILDEARRVLRDVPDVAFAAWDARAVPRPDHAFDIVLCSLALHHFSPDDAILLLREMHRLAGTGFIVNDIRRSAPGYAMAWAASRVATRNRLTRHDMPLSVRRAYTPAELRAFCQKAGVPGVRITTHPLFRMAAVYRAPEPAR